MKTPLSILCALCALCGSLRGSTITGTIVNVSGTGYAARMQFIPLSNPQFEGSTMINSGIRNMTNNSNGTFSIVLEQGDYRVLVDGRDKFKISVPNDGATYGINTLSTSLATFIYTTPPATSATLAGLMDVLLSSPTDGQSLTYQSSTGKWINSTVSGGGGGSGNVLFTDFNSSQFGTNGSPALYLKTNITSALIVDGTIVNADINASAAIALSKLSTDPLARANHTGTQLASTISDFNSAASGASAAGAATVGGDVTGTVASMTLAAAAISGKTEDVTPDGANDFVITYDASAGALKKVKLNNLPASGTGEANTGGNLGTGWPLFDSKSGVALRFDSITNDTSITISSNANLYTFGRAALTGDVTASAGANATTIANAAVTFAKMQNISGYSIIGKATTGTGVPAEITSGTDAVLGRDGSGNVAFAKVATNQISSSQASSGQVIGYNGSFVGWVTPAGSGDVTAASTFGTDNRVIRSDGTGKGVQSSGVTLDDSNNLSGIGTVSSGAITATGITTSGRSTFNGDITYGSTSGLTIDWSATGKVINFTTQNANFGLTFSGSAQAHSMRRIVITNSSSSDIVMTNAANVSEIATASVGASTSTKTILANSVAILTFQYDGVTYWLYGAEHDNPRISGIVGLGSGGGMLALTDATNSALRTITAGAGVSLSNGNGVSGNPTVTWDASTAVNNVTLWDGSQASRTFTINLSGTDPVWTYTSSTANLSTGTLQQGGTAVALQNLTLTVAGTANEITSSAGAQDLSANRTWTLSLPSALTFTGKTVTGGTFSGPTLTGTVNVNGSLIVTNQGSFQDLTVTNKLTNSVLTASLPVFTAADKSLSSTGTIDASSANVTLKWIEYDKFAFPALCDGAGAIIATNNNSTAGWGHATFSGSGATNANWVEYDWIVPDDIDTGIDLKVARFQFKTAGTSTSSITWNIGMLDIADSADADSTTFSNWVQFTSGTLSSPAANDLFTLSAVTLTSWRTSVTAGHRLKIRLNRDGSADANNDAQTEKLLVISYGRTQ